MMNELTQAEMVQIDGGVIPALVVWVGYGLLAAGAGVAVGLLVG